MTTNRLLYIMGKIACQLIKSHMSDFEGHDTDQINKTNGQVKFIWQVRDAGTWLYMYNEEDWTERLIERIDYYKNAGISNIYYYYDRNKLKPIFENEARYIARKYFELRQKYLQNSMSIREVLDDAKSSIEKTDAPYVKENILIIVNRAESLLTAGYDEKANYISSWKEFAENIYK